MGGEPEVWTLSNPPPLLHTTLPPPSHSPSPARPHTSLPPSRLSPPLRPPAFITLAHPVRTGTAAGVIREIASRPSSPI